MDSNVDCAETRRCILTGDTLTSTISGWSGSPATLQTRTTTVTLYAIGEAAAFNPGGVFQASWAALPQPLGMRKSMDGPRGDVADTETLVYYPVDTAVPATLRGHLAARKNAAGHITRFTAYNLHGYPTTIIDPNGVAQTLVYDPLGRLVQTQLEPVSGCDTSADPLCATALTTSRQWSLRRGGRDIVALSTPLPAAREEIVWFGDRPVAQVGPLRSTIPDPEFTRHRIGTMSIPADRALYFTFSDHLGTPILQTDAAATIVWHAEYEPYGAIWDARRQA